MSALDTSQEMTIGRDWARSLVLLLICVFVLVSFTYFLRTEADGHIDQRAKTGAYIIVPIFALFTPFVIFRLFVPFGPLLRIGPEGFADRRVSSQLVPWSEVKNIVARSEFVTLTLSRRFAKTYPMSLGQKILKRRRKAGPSHLVVADWCVKQTSPGLFDILTSYRAAHGAAPAT